jgi:ribonuclease P protein component
VSEKNTFPKKIRLLKKTQFQTCILQEQFLKEKYFIFYYYLNGLSHPRLGIIATKKKCRLAVWRNRLKRQTREAFRHYQSKLFNYDIVVIIRQGAHEACNSEIRQCLNNLLLKLSDSSLK